MKYERKSKRPQENDSRIIDEDKIPLSEKPVQPKKKENIRLGDLSKKRLRSFRSYAFKD